MKIIDKLVDIIKNRKYQIYDVQKKDNNDGTIVSDALLLTVASDKKEVTISLNVGLKPREVFILAGILTINLKNYTILVSESHIITDDGNVLYDKNAEAHLQSIYKKIFLDEFIIARQLLSGPSVGSA